MSNFPAYGVTEPSVNMKEVDITKPELGNKMVEVEITHNGICHSDIHCLLDEWKGLTGVSNFQNGNSFVPGHEAVGIVKRVGSDVTSLKVGQRVGFGPFRYTCMECKQCTAGTTQFCSKLQGLYDHIQTGGFGSVITAPADYAFPIPDALESKYAAPLLCAGVTVFSPLRAHAIGKLPAGARIGVVGIGGLGHLAIQYIKSLGFEAVAITRSLNKADMIKKLGAEFILDSTNAEEMSKHASTFDMILNTASSSQDVTPYLSLLNPAGKLIILGIGEENFTFNPMALLFGNKQIIGSQVGSIEDTVEMLKYSAEHNIVPMIEVCEAPFGQGCADKVTDAIQKVIDNKVRFRVVLDYKKDL